MPTRQSVDVEIPFRTEIGDKGRLEFSYESGTTPFFEQANGPERSQAAYRGALRSFRLYLNDSLIRSGIDSDNSMSLRDFGEVFGSDEFFSGSGFRRQQTPARVFR